MIITKNFSDTLSVDSKSVALMNASSVATGFTFNIQVMNRDDMNNYKENIIDGITNFINDVVDNS